MNRLAATTGTPQLNLPLWLHPVGQPPKAIWSKPRAHLVFNQQKSLPIATVGPRPSQVVRSTALGVLFPELQEYIAPCPRLRTLPRLLLFL
jgi:hypothetical protein